MKQVFFVACLAIVITCPVGPGTFAATVDFESVPRTLFGEAFGDAPGDIVLTQDGIATSVEEFFFDSFVGFVKAEVGGRYGDFFPTTPLGLDNISSRFDFSDVGFDVTLVTLEYQEFGGGNNFAVNGDRLYQLSPLADLPEEVAPGVVASVEEGVITLVALDGYIDDFLIGGQELAIDNIVALPEPPTVISLILSGAVLFRRRSAPGGSAPRDWSARRPKA